MDIYMSPGNWAKSEAMRSLIPRYASSFTKSHLSICVVFEPLRMHSSNLGSSSAKSLMKCSA